MQALEQCLRDQQETRHAHGQHHDDVAMSPCHVPMISACEKAAPRHVGLLVGHTGLAAKHITKIMQVSAGQRHHVDGSTVHTCLYIHSILQCTHCTFWRTVSYSSSTQRHAADQCTTAAAHTKWFFWLHANTCYPPHVLQSSSHLLLCRKCDSESQSYFVC